MVMGKLICNFEESGFKFAFTAYCFISKQIVRTYRNYTFRICVTTKRALPLNNCLLNLLELIIREKAVF